MVRTIFPNAFQQGNASIYTFVYLVRAPNSRTQSMSQLRGKTSNLANVSQGLWLLGSWLAPWRPESRDKKEIKGMSQSFIFLFLMPSSILEALGVGRAENLALFSDASLTFLFSVSYFLLLSSVALFPPVALFFLSWFLPVMRFPRPLCLAAVLPWVKGIRAMMVTMRKMTLVTIVPCHNGYRLLTCMTLNPQVDT